MTIAIVILAIISALYATLSITEALRRKRESEMENIRKWARKARQDDIDKGHYRSW